MEQGSILVETNERMLSATPPWAQPRNDDSSPVANVVQMGVPHDVWDTCRKCFPSGCHGAHLSRSFLFMGLLIYLSLLPFISNLLAGTGNFCRV